MDDYQVELHNPSWRWGVISLHESLGLCDTANKRKSLQESFEVVPLGVDKYQ